MPEPTSESRETEMLKRKILQNINNINELAAILRSFKGLDHVPMDDRVELMRLVFTAESKTPRYDLITYLWNFLKILYNNMDKRVLRLIPAIAIDRHTELSEKQVILFKEITTRLYYVMVYMKDTDQENIEIMCKNVLVLSKYLIRQGNYTELFNLAKESFFNPRHSYQIKLFADQCQAHDIFLEHFLTRLWEFRDITEEDLKRRDMTSGDLFEKLFQIFIFYLNYESRPATPSKYTLTDKLISVLLNLQLAKSDKDLCNSIKCLYSIAQLMKEDSNQETASKLLLQYMTRICEKTTLNSCPYASDTLATIAVVLERNQYFQEERNIQQMSLETIRYILQTIKLTVNLNCEPTKPVCEQKECVKNTRKHSITSLTRFSQKLFVAYLSKLPDTDKIDEDLLTTTTQLVIFHFHVMDRLTCVSRVANEHNDVRRLYCPFAHRSKSQPPAGVLKIFEIVLKYNLQRNLTALVTPVSMLLIKYYTETSDTVNCDRIEWINLLCRNVDSSSPNAVTAFDNCCYNWAVKKQKLTKEELMPILLTMKDTKLDYNTDIIPPNYDPARVLLRILESIAVLNYKAFRVLQECLVEIILGNCKHECSKDVVNILFYATESQIVCYHETVKRNREFFEENNKSTCHISLAVLYSLEYQVYNSIIRQDIKTVDINALQNRDVALKMLSVEKETKKQKFLTESLRHLRLIPTSAILTDNPRQLRQVLGTLKRNIRFFQLAALEFEEVSCCKLLYELAGNAKDVEGTVLAMGNLMNHVHFVVKDERCREEWPDLIRMINGEGSELLANELRNIKEAKESLQTLIVFGIGNVIRLNADLGRLAKSYEYLCVLKQKIDEVGGTKEEQSVLDLQYDLISFQLFLKYAPQSQVNPLMVVRKIFSAVRLLQKASDLYSLYLYDVLVELFCFSVPRYETKGLDFYICTVLKYFMGNGSVTRIVDVMLIYANWALCGESVEKCAPVMEYIAEIILGEHEEIKRKSIAGTDVVKMAAAPETNVVNLFVNTDKLQRAIVMCSDKKSSLWLAIVGFKLNCLLAKKNYMAGEYEEARQRYEEAWSAYDEISGRIANISLKLELQQFYVNALFQLSNVYYKLNMPTKRFRFCEQTTVMISEILVNRIALTQEAYFQGLAFKTEVVKSKTKSVVSPVSPVNMNRDIAKLIKATSSRSGRKRVPPKEGSSTPIRSARKAAAATKKSSRVASVTSDSDSPILLSMASLSIAIAVDENASIVGNNNITGVDVEESTTATIRKSTAGIRKIPVRNNTKTTSASGIAVVAKKKTTTRGGAGTTTETVVTAANSTASVGCGTTTRKSSRRLI